MFFKKVEIIWSEFENFKESQEINVCNIKICIEKVERVNKIILTQKFGMFLNLTA